MGLAVGVGVGLAGGVAVAVAVAVAVGVGVGVRVAVGVAVPAAVAVAVGVGDGVPHGTYSATSSINCAVTSPGGLKPSSCVRNLMRTVCPAYADMFTVTLVQSAVSHTW